MILAENAGFCFGVRRAVDMARKNAPAVTLGPIIHNPFAVEQLRTEGVVSVDSVDDVAPESRVVIRSHGVSKAEYEALAAKNCRIVDATCPFVERIHEIARRTGEENRALIIIGAREHPEVKGILGWTDGRAWAVSSEEEIRDLPPLDDAVVVSQTTMPEARFDELLRLVEEKVAHVDVRRTICTATKLRQSEAVRIAARSQVMLVVGSRASSNSVKLWELCRQVLERTYLVETAREVYSIPVHKGENIGITAGASTPDCIIKEVVASMNDIEKQVTPSEEKQEQADASADFMADVEKTLVQIRPGQTITGTVVQITDDEVCVNVGYKADGLVKKSDLSSTDVKIGDEIEVEVVKVNDGEGNVLLSQRNLVNRKNWDEIVAKYEAGEFVQGVGKEAVKGGLLADVLGIRTFIPASQLSQRYVEKIDSFVGQEMNLKIIEVDKAKKRIVASRKAVLAVEEAERKKAIWATIEPGTIVKGVVRRLADFGAFVDIGGVDGLVHVTDLSWAHGLKPSDVVSVNQEIDVKILNVDPERERISLSYKATQPKPWVVAAELPVGSIVEGKVVRITTFGAFVELMPGLDGLVHISQCAPTRIAKVEDAVQVGQTVNVKILDVDVEKKRISLSIKEALGYEALNEPVGDKVEEEYAIKSEE